MEAIKEKASSTAIIILNYNNYEDTINCIESVEQHNTAPVKLIVVDNASPRKGVVKALEGYLRQRYGEQCNVLDDDAVEAMRSNQRLAYCTYIESRINDGYACGNNKGLRAAEKDDTIEYVMILNNDVLFVQDIIPSLMQRSVEIPDAALLSPLLYKCNMEGYDYNCARKDTTLGTELVDNFFHYIFQLIRRSNPLSERRYLLKYYSTLPIRLEIELPSGSCMFIKKDLLKQIGYFDSNTFLYYEENILYRKVKKLHKQNYLLTDLKCIHLGAMSTSAVSYSYKRMKKAMESPMYYFKYYYGLNKLQYQIYKFSVAFYLFSLRIQKFCCSNKDKD